MTYKEEYKLFMETLESGEPIPAETVGRLIVKFAQYFSDAISEAVKTEYRYRKILAVYENKTDDNGKPLSSTKAEAQAEATPEYLAYIEAKANVTSIEVCINAFKSLQKSLQNEYQHMGI